MYFTKSLLLLSCALSAYAIATPHMARDLHHHAVVARNVAAPATADPVAPSVVPRKRSINRRCRATASSALASSSSSAVASSSAAASSSAVRSSSSAVASTSVKASSSAAASTSAAPVNVGGDVPTFASSSAAPSTSAKPTTSSKAAVETSSSEAPVKTSSSEAPAKTSSTEAPTPSTTKATTTSSKAPAKTSTSEAPAATTSASSSSDTGSFIDGTHSGDATFYGTGLGACGITNTDTDFIAAASEKLFDIFPGYNGVNPNTNPICGRKVTANYGGNTVSITITDRCVACAEWDLDFSPAAFDVLADPAIGRLHGMTWSFD